MTNNISLTETFLRKQYDQSTIDAWVDSDSKGEVLSDLIEMVEDHFDTNMMDYMYKTGENIEDTIKRIFTQLK